jgi:hypothetical protein
MGRSNNGTECRRNNFADKPLFQHVRRLDVYEARLLATVMLHRDSRLTGALSKFWVKGA